MTIETKYNIGDIISYKKSDNNELFGDTLQGKIMAVGTFDNGKDSFITYTIHQKNSMSQDIVFEQQIIGIA